MASIGIVGKQRRAIGALLDGLWYGLTVYPIETGKECLDALTVKVRQGPSAPDEHCLCRTGLVIAPYLGFCEDGSDIADAFDALDLLTGCGEGSIQSRLAVASPNGKRRGVALAWEGESVGVIERIEPAVLYGYAQFNTDGPNNSVSAQVAVTIRFSCCGGGA